MIKQHRSLEPAQDLILNAVSDFTISCTVSKFGTALYNVNNVVAKYCSGFHLNSHV